MNGRQKICGSKVGPLHHVVFRRHARIVARGHRTATLAHLIRQTISKASKWERVTDGLMRWLESSHYLVFEKYQRSDAGLVIRGAHA